MQDPRDQAFINVQVSALYTYPEPRNRRLKMQKQFALSFPMPTLAETYRIVFVTLNDDFMALDIQS
jgi:hypothetical protein